MCANYFWRVDIYIILPDTGLFSTPHPFEMGNYESSQEETGSESEDTGSPSQAIPDDIQAQNIVIRWRDQGEIPTPRKEIWLCPSPGSWCYPKLDGANFDHHLSGSKHQSYGFSSSLVWV